MALVKCFFIAAMDIHDRYPDYDAIQYLIRKAHVERDAAAGAWLAEFMAAAVRSATRLGRFPIRRARSTDLPEIVKLVNAASTGDGGTAGWTHELGLFHGDRTDAAEIRGLFAAPGAVFLLWLESGQVGGCAYLSSSGYMRMLCVRPTLQGRGIASRLIAECERVAREEMACRTLRISVITSHRPEITTFYRRRGFVLTGQTKEFERKQAARIEGLRLEWMEKDLLAHSRFQLLLKGFASWLHRTRPTRAPASAGQYGSR